MVRGEPILSVAALALPLFVQAYQVGRLPLSRLVQAIPDDAFFYLVLARNRATSGIWSFDHVAPATGFHLAYGYLLLVLDEALPGRDLHTQIRIVLWSAAIIMLAGFVSLLRVLEGSARAALTCGLLLLLAAPTGRIQAMLAMETPLVIAATAMLYAVVLRAEKSGTPAVTSAIAIGVFGTFARTEFLLLPGSLLAAAFLLGRGGARSQPIIMTVGLALVGSMVGLAAVTLHTYLTSGALIQSSALIKHHWAEAYGYNPWPALLLFAELWDPLQPHRAMFALFLGVLVWAALLSWLWYGRGNGRIVVAGAALFIPLAVIAYGFEPFGLQIWYFGIFLMPLALLVATILVGLPDRTLPFVAAVTTLLALGSSLTAPAMLWPIQKSAMDAGLMLRDDPSATPVGNWGGGVISWFSERDVINLDGVVNDDIYRYLARDRLDAYFDDRHIGYLIDLPFVLEADGSEYVYGMSCGRLTRRLVPLRTVKTADEMFPPEMRLTLYRVLASAPDYHLGDAISFFQAGNAASFKGCGWRLPDAAGTTLGDNGDAVLLLKLGLVPSSPLEIEIDATAAAPTTLALSTEAGVVGSWKLQAGVNHVSALITDRGSSEDARSFRFRATGPAGTVSFQSIVLHEAATL